jgi:glutaminase
MYDYSGEWLYRVGLPAKSGVGGGIIAVLPGQLGIGIFSPSLDSQGNSVRGIRVCADLSRDLGLHLFSPAAAPPPALRREFDAGSVASKRRRPAKALRTLRNYGSRIRVLELQGELIFSSVEPVVRELIRLAPYTLHIILDMRRVTGADPIALQMLASTRTQLATAEPPVRVVFTHADATVQHELLCAGAGESSIFPDTDAAMESAEDLLLAELCGSAWQPPNAVELSQCQLLRDCAADDVEWLAERMPARNFENGQAIVTTGEMASEIFFITTGSVEVRLRSGDKVASRLDVFTAGMSFGEMAFLDGSPRSADVIAMEPVECRVIDHALFIAMEKERPQLKFALLTALARQVTANLRQTNRELAAMRA